MRETQGIRHDFAGVQALVVGLAREGTALTRFLAERAARVTVTDAKPAGALAENVDSLADLPVTYALGGHPLAILDGVDIVFVSPGVPLEIPLLAEARRRELPLSSETRLFTHLCPAPVMGITGSSGKTTTTALVSEMLKAAGRPTWVGGNIGRPLIGQLDEIVPTGIVVMELSSFQLELFAPWTGKRTEGYAPGSPAVLFEPRGWSPSFAAVLNVTPNHLDRHATMEAYIAAKSHVLAHQHPGDVVVLNLDNPISRQMGEAAGSRGQALWFSLEQEVSQGAFLRGETLILRLGSREGEVCRVGELKLLGKHNLANALAACALAGAAGASIEVLRSLATTFRGVEHRLELVRELDGVYWYDDSIATSPERTVAALQAFPDAPIVLLAGGRDKHLPWDEMAALTWQRVRHLILFGEAAGLIEGAMRDSQFSVLDSCRIRHAGTVKRAVELAAQVAQPGDVVLLSPGGTSFDAYPDFVARGEHFKQLVKALE
jgi:UDP-N-acetylmuramoylalanine--D-glutamate ligase